MGGNCFYMPKFFVDKSNICDNIVNIVGEDVDHIRKVLRYRCGDHLIVCDGHEIDYLVKIDEIGVEYVKTSIVEIRKCVTEPVIDVTLFQGLPKFDKMDFIIQKGVELGVNRIVPVITDRTIVKIGDKKEFQKKLNRWQKIAYGAAKQSNRGKIPLVESPISFNDALNQMRESDLSIIPYENETNYSLKNYLIDTCTNTKKVSVLIGPEGGFTEHEIQSAVFLGIKSVCLGPRILRTETAGLIVLTILMYELGDVY